MKKSLLLLTAFIFLSNYLSAQNSMVGDGFGGRGWYVPHNYQVGAYSAYTVCGDSNQLYVWGGNYSGELGNETNIPSTAPVAALGMNNVKFYTTGYVSAVIKKDSTAWVWGSHPNIRSGFSITPTQVLTNVKFADGGTSHVVFVKYDGTVWAAGRNRLGELGNGTTSMLPINLPVQMTGIYNGVRAVALGNSGDNTCATIILLADSTVQITGGGGWFQPTNSAVPIKLEGLNNIIDIKGGDFAAYALNSDGEVFSFGKDFGSDYPALGLGNTNGVYTPPTKVIFPEGSAPIVALSANNDGYSCLALDSNHKVYGWGVNYFGQLGDSTILPKSTPTLVATNVVDIFAGENFSYILKTDNSLWSTGRSGYPSIYMGSIWMNLPNFQRNIFTQIDPTIPPMNLCAPKVWGVVPIKLSTFTCVANGSNAILNWQSAEEINADKYIVEYSKDGNNFQSIATINAKGSNSKYNYVHQQVSGTAFYRLKMMDKDGSFKYSEIRVVKFDTKAGFTIAPNPANNVVYVFTKSNAAIKSIQIVSIDGQVIKILNEYHSGQQISISTLGRGTYILKAVYQNNEMEYGRFIKL